MEWSPERLFHVIVVLGTATTSAAGCAAKSQALPGNGGTSTGGAAGSSSGGMPATAGDGGFTINAGGSLGSGGASVAGRPGTGGEGASAAGNGGNGEPGGEGGEGGGLSRTPCEHDQQYLCYPVDDFVECRCDVNAPLSEADCGGRPFECMSYDPPTGCSCSYITGPK